MARQAAEPSIKAQIECDFAASFAGLEDMAAYDGDAGTRRLPDKAAFRLPRSDDPDRLVQFRLVNADPRPQPERARVQLFDSGHRSIPLRPSFEIHEDRPNTMDRSRNPFLA